MFLYLDISAEPPQPLLLGGAKPKAVLVLSPLTGEMSFGQRGSTLAASLMFQLRNF
jgi:hypothetical protein